MTLYVLTADSKISTPQFCATVEEALVGGAEMVQFRDKQHSLAERTARGMALAKVCKAYGVPLIVNDSISLAHAIRADGVHLGRDDGSVHEARSALGKRAIIGVSCYDSFDRGVIALQEGADYAAFGACFPSQTKPGTSLVSLDVIRRAHEELAIRVCCIGGIDATNVASLMEAGADMIAVCAAVFGGANIRERTAAIKHAMRAAAPQV